MVQEDEVPFLEVHPSLQTWEEEACEEAEGASSAGEEGSAGHVADLVALLSPPPLFVQEGLAEVEGASFLP